MKKIIIGILLIMTLVFLAGCINVGTDTDDEEEDPVTPVQTWTWNLKYGWNYIAFTQLQIDACRSDAPRDILSSIMGSVDAVFQKLDGEYKVWSPTLPDWVIDLHHVLPNVECEIHCTADCVLTI